jgi:hypothetical protein
LEPHHFHLLRLAAEALDRAEIARETLAAEGLTFTDRFGSPRPRPECQVVRDSSATAMRLIRELDLDGEVIPAGPRAPAIRSNRGR